jgi:hypothetical protein
MPIALGFEIIEVMYDRDRKDRRSRQTPGSQFAGPLSDKWARDVLFRCRP